MSIKARFSSILVSSLVLSGAIVPAGCDRNGTSQTQPTTAASGSSNGAQSLPTVKMKIADRTFDLEVARTSEQQATGLMKRDSMPENHGMIFVFEDEHMLEFWMKDTRIPLDIIYLDGQAKVVWVQTMQPYDQSTVSSQVPAQYAIELNAGLVKKLGIKTGDVLDIPPAARSPNRPAATQP
jgi:uncharacterized membrane protein (UPF0127 family)